MTYHPTHQVSLLPFASRRPAPYPTLSGKSLAFQMLCSPTHHRRHPERRCGHGQDTHSHADPPATFSSLWPTRPSPPSGQQASGKSTCCTTAGVHDSWSDGATNGFESAWCHTTFGSAPRSSKAPERAGVSRQAYLPWTGSRSCIYRHIPESNSAAGSCASSGYSLSVGSV